jgi:MFS-type transporter involved in bile tolerance (Atg22 family)
MNQASRPHQTLRSIGAVFAGLVAVFVLSLGTDAVLHVAGIFPAWGQPMSDTLFLLATLYRTVYGVAGSYLAARLAPDRPMGHAMTLGIVGMVLSTLGTVGTWNRGPAFGPHWYPVSLIVTSLPCAWLGGWLRVRQSRTR